MGKSNTPNFSTPDETGDAEVADVTNEVEEIPSEETDAPEERTTDPDGYREVSPGVQARSASEALMDERTRQAQAEIRSQN